MNLALDGSGRLVIPKVWRERLGLSVGGELRMEEFNGGLLISPVAPAPEIVETPDGPVIAARVDAKPLTDDMVRDLMDRARP